MAIGWLAILQNVPWSEVINNAPKVADGAMKLWNTVARKSFGPEVAEASAEPATSPESRIAELENRTVALEADAADLHEQMLASSELIKALAEQNAQLIQRIEHNRVRMWWIGAGAAAAVVTALLALVLTMARQAV